MTGIIAQEVKSALPGAIDWIIDDLVADPVMSVSSPPESNITFYTGPAEILKVAEDGFYIRGEKVPVDDKEALAVYKAFKEFLVYHALSKP